MIMNVNSDKSLSRLAEQLSPSFDSEAQGFGLLFSPHPGSVGTEFELIASDNANLNTPNVVGSRDESFTFIRPENLPANTNGEFFGSISCWISIFLSFNVTRQPACAAVCVFCHRSKSSF